ncbi:TolC family protein [Rubidibacter lacunae]|nr:TolC family protein [Rubidibacter lacunae]
MIACPNWFGVSVGVGVAAVLGSMPVYAQEVVPVGNRDEVASTETNIAPAASNGEHVPLAESLPTESPVFDLTIDELGDRAQVPAPPSPEIDSADGIPVEVMEGIETELPAELQGQSGEDSGFEDPGQVINVPQPDFAPVSATTESLQPNGNPLLFPTESEEVEIQTYQRITLDQAIEIARQNNTDLRVARQNLEAARLFLREARAAEFPDVSTQINISRVDSAGAEIANQRRGPFLPESDEVTSSLDANIRVDYDIFTSGSRTATIRRAEELVLQSQLDVEIAAEQLRLDVTNSYYEVQEADTDVLIEAAAVEDATQSLRDAQLLEQAGLGTRFSVLQAEVELSNAEQDLRNARAAQQTARRELADVLNVGEQVEVTTVEGPPEEAGEWTLPLEETIVLAFRNRAELQREITDINVDEQDRRIALAAVRPQFAAFARGDVLEEFGDGVNGGDGITVGAQMSWTIYDGGAAQSQARQEDVSILANQTQFEDVRNDIRVEVETAYFNLEANKENIDTARLGVEQAEESLRLARLRFQAGVGTQTDVINSQTALTDARGNLLDAIINYNRSLAALQRAVSNLPDGRLFDLP